MHSTTTDDTVRLRAHAKINLALSVGPAIPQGLQHAGHHPIASWMAALDLADEITIAPASRCTVDVAWHDGRPVDWPPHTDLTARALAEAQALAGRDLRVAVTVRKRIPAGGGLGGGSADAAVVLDALVRRFAPGVHEAGRRAAAARLGSDVPFFLDPPHAFPRPAVVTGTGERIDRVAPTWPAGRAVVLIFPPFACPTGEVYSAYDASPAPLRDAEVRALAAAPLDPDTLFNDLAAPAERVRPALADVRLALSRAAGLPVHVSGSGSTLFVLPPQDAHTGRVLAAAAALGLPAQSAVLLVP